MQPTTTAQSGPVVAAGTRPSRFRARAFWGEQLVADSSDAVLLSEPGGPDSLYFPPSDVRLELLADEGRTARCEVKGEARLWTLPGEVAADNRSWSAETRPATVDGRDAAWSFAAPSAGLAALSGHIAFDHDRLRVELVDTMGSEDPRDTCLKRFPAWGDLADLLEIMQVREAPAGHFTGAAYPDGGRPVVEGSQLLGQAIVAAGRIAPGRRVVSAHLVFFRGADARLPLEFHLEQLTSGRSFTTLAVRVVQDGRPRAAGTLLLDVTTPDLIRHADTAPAAAGPYDSVPHDMSVTGRDLRVADAAYTDDPDAPLGPPVIDAWVRFRSPLDDDPALHAGLLAQFTGHMSIAAALRPHAGIGQSQAHRTISTGINAISLSMHRDVRADEWMRYHHRATYAGDGMTHAQCQVYDEAGDLLASFTVEAMVRGFADTSQEGKARTAM